MASLTVPPELPWPVADRETLAAVDDAELAARAGVDEEAVAAVLDALAEFEAERKPWRDPRVLWRRYYCDGQTQREIADDLGCGQRTVARWMDRHDLAPGKSGGAKQRLVATIHGETDD